MALANRMQQNELIIVQIEQVDLPNRIVHARDKTRSPIMVSFRDASSAVLHVPEQDELWTAKRVGTTWRLESRLDSLDEHLWAAANMSEGDTRITANTLFFDVAEMILNGQPIGATTYNVFSANGSSLTYTLDTQPVGEHTVQVFENGLLVDPRTYLLSGATLTFQTAPPSGVLVVYFQRWAQAYTDSGVVVGRAVISSGEGTTVGSKTQTAIARIILRPAKTQPAIARISTTRSKTQPAKANIVLGGYGVGTYGTKTYGT